MIITPNQVTNDYIYICGPITKITDGNKAAFYKAEEQLNSFGLKTINPHELFLGVDTRNYSHQDYMDLCISYMAMCGTILTLDGWWLSDGATQEVNIARLMKKKVILYDSFFAGLKRRAIVN